MGNLISCSTPSAIAVSSSRRAASASSSARVAGAVNSSNYKKKKKEAEGARMKEVARVLLVDGSVLEFKQQMKVLHVLAHYPDHYVCPLDSLRPGHHSLSTLSPHNHLHPGRLYLLLPLRQPALDHSPPTSSHRQRCCSSSDHPLLHAAAAPDQHDPPLLHSRKSCHRPRMHAAAAADHEFVSSMNVDAQQAHVVPEQHLQVPLGCKKRSVYPLHSAAHADSNDDSRSLPLKQQGNRSHADRPKHVADHGYGDGVNSRSAGGSCAAAQRKYRSNDPHHMKYFAPLQDDCNRPSYMRIMDKTMRCSSSRSSSSRIISADNDTPELKKAYRSSELRRCRSWTPRLHAIAEMHITS